MTNEYNHDLPVMSLVTEIIRTSRPGCHYHLAKTLRDAGLLVTDEEWRESGK